MTKATTYQPMPLGDVVRFGNGKSIKPGGKGLYPVYGSNGIIGGSGEYRHENGIIIGRVGAYCGSVAYCPERFWASDNTLVAFPASDAFDTKFLFYLLTDARLSRHAGGAAQPLVTQTVLKQVEVSVPPLPVQRRIAGILSAYDDLIENNQRRIKILEQLARSLYREWFVHFRFPGHNKVKMVPSSLGPIPHGWELKNVKEVIARRPNGQVYREENVASEGTIPVIDQSTNELLGFHDSEPDHLATPKNPIAIFGDHTCKMQLLVEPFSIGPNVVAFESNVDRPLSYLFQLVQSLVQTQEYKRHWSQLNAKEIVLADKSTTQHFATSIQPSLQQAEVLRRASRVLRRTRDLLLPQLLSGQVNLNSMDAIT